MKTIFYRVSGEPPLRIYGGKTFEPRDFVVQVENGEVAHVHLHGVGLLANGTVGKHPVQAYLNADVAPAYVNEALTAESLSWPQGRA